VANFPIINNLRIVPRDSEFLDRKLGSRGEIYFDKDTKTLRIYDGLTAGGIPLSKADLTNVQVNDFVDLLHRSNTAIVEYVVTVGGAQGADTGNKYFLNDAYRPELDFVIGYTYIFNQNDQTNVYYPNDDGGTINQHPLNFSSNDPNGELGSGTTYTDGVVYKLDDIVVTKAQYWSGFSSATTREVRITITKDTPSVLYYWCQNHLNMGHDIAVSNPGSGSGGNSFSIVRVPEQTDIVAESSQDFITFIGTNGIDITTNSATDTVTFNSTGILDLISANDGLSISGDSSGTYTIANTGVLSLEAGSGIDILDDSSGGYTITAAVTDFKSIAVAGQTTISATQIDDTLTFSGVNLTITTDEESKSIIFTAPQSVTTAFKTISVSGQSDVIADSAEDVLQLVAGPNISITTSAGGDSITISGTAGDGEASGVSTGEANRLAYYSTTGQVIQDTGAQLTWDGTILSLNGSPVVTQATESKTEIFIAADDSTIRVVRDQESIKFIGGTGISTASDIDGNITIANDSPNVDQNVFTSIAVAGQTNITADSTTDTLTLVAGSNITITTDPDTDSLTIAASGGGVSSDSFATISIAGQDDVVADSSSDTLTLVAGLGISLTSDASTDSITIASSSASQNLFETVSADAGSTTANTATDTLSIRGGTDISTSITGDILTINYSGTAAENFDDLTDVSDAGLTVDKIYLPAITMLEVTNIGASSYRFDQYGTTDNPTIYAINGTTIAFHLNVIGHPFLIQDSTGTNYDTGLIHVGIDGTVSTGSSAQGKTSGTLYWKIPTAISSPPGYRYQCSIHTAMVGSITIKNFGSI